MRRVINLCLLAVAILSSSVAIGSERVSVEITNSSVVNVSLKEVVKGEKLILKDFYGEVLFNVTLQTASNYQKNFNLSDVPNGVYFVESETIYEVKITPVLKNNLGVSLIDTSSITLFKPQVSIKDNMVQVLLNNTRAYPVNLVIHDSNWTVLEEITANTEEVLKRAYDFSDMPIGEYTLRFRIGERTFVEKIKI